MAIKINKLVIGYNHTPKIIAEIGINHEGSLDTAKKMCELAAEGGADVIKTQLHLPSEEMSVAAKNLVPGHCTESIFEIMEHCALNIDEEFKLKEFIESLDCTYLSTPFSAKAAHVLGAEFKVSAFKIGSGECNNPSVIDAAASYSKPLIVSTGMNSLSSCKITYEYLEKTHHLKPILMHTTNLYPTPKSLVRLGGIEELQKLAGKDYVGLSDHTVDNTACVGAVALGAVVLERHFTDTKERQGPDIENSMDKEELQELRRMVDDMYLMRGGSKYKELEEEQGVRDFAFATVVSTKHIREGELFSMKNTQPKRPGKGDISAREHNQIIGKKASRSIPPETHIKLEDIS